MKTITAILALVLSAAVASSAATVQSAEVTCVGHSRQVGRVIFGTDGDDVIVCRDTPLSLVIIGGNGNDIIGGGTGNDVIIGGPGKDIIFGTPGDDQIDGGPDDDRLFGGDGDDTLMGGDGDDWIWGEEGKDFCDGQEGQTDWISPSCIDDLLVQGIPYQEPPWVE